MSNKNRSWARTTRTDDEFEERFIPHRELEKPPAPRRVIAAAITGKRHDDDPRFNAVFAASKRRGFWVGKEDGVYIIQKFKTREELFRSPSADRTLAWLDEQPVKFR